MSNLPAPVRAVLAAIAAIAAVGVTIIVVDATDDAGQPRRTVTVHVGRTAPPSVPTTAKVDGPDADGKLDDTVTVAPAAANRLEDALTAGQAELTDPLRQAHDSPATTTVPGPLAADEVPGCRTRFVGNSSSRNGARPLVIYLHQTVSREFGWSSQNALTALAARRSSGVSWHLLVGRSSGRCTYTVPLALKAWTQANANPNGIGIEVEATGSEGAYVVGAGRARLVSVVRYIARRYSIPLQRARVDRASCRVIRAGIAEHSDAGLCGGGHVDVTLSPSDAASYIAGIARAAGPTTRAPRTKVERARCGGLRHHRRAVKAGKSYGDRLTVNGKRTTRGRRARYLKSALTRAHVNQAHYCA